MVQCFRLIFKTETEPGVLLTTDNIILVLLLLLPDKPLFSEFFVLLKSLVTVMRLVQGQALWPSLEHKMT